MQGNGREQISVRLDGLQLDESRPFQRVVWALQRAAWFLFALTIAAALAGATGRGGPLAESSVTRAAAVATVPRIARRGAPARLVVAFRQDAPDHRLFLPPALLRQFAVQTARPRPVAELAVDGGVLLLFAAAGPPPHVVELDLRAVMAGYGRLVPIADGDALPFDSVTLP